MISVVFEYEVEGTARADFERVYGPEGEWAAFFRRDEAYLGTELLASAGDEARHLVIDRWASADAYASFLAANTAEYARRSQETAPLYLSETRVGAFERAGTEIGLELGVLPGVFAVCRLEPGAEVPARFWSVTRTADELSVICLEDAVPEGAQVEHGWRGLRVAGPLDFALTGVAAALTAPLAAAGVSVLPVATFDTDHLFVRQASLPRALAALTAAGHVIR